MRRARLAAVIATGLLSCAPALAASKPYNVILISIDTLAADHMSLYGYGRDTTPNLERFAREAVTFDNAQAQAAYTLASHYSMFTGTYVQTHRVSDPSSDAPLSPQIKTLTERLKARGYHTFWVGQLEDRELNRARGLGRGFDESIFRALSRLAREDVVRRNLGELFKKRFFLFLHTYWVHDPYVPKPPFDTRFDPSFRRKLELDADAITAKVIHDSPHLSADELFLRTRRRYLGQFDLKKPADLEHFISLYDGAIAEADELLGRFFGILKKLGVYDNTLIVVTSDHGETFGKRGMFFHSTPSREELHIPLLMKIPGVAPRRVGAEALSIDIVPTVLAALDLPEPERIDGVSLLPLLEGRSQVHTGYRYAWGYRTEAIWDDEWKLCFMREGQASPDLFNTRLDPYEEESLYWKYAEKARTMRAAAEARGLKERRPE